MAGRKTKLTPDLQEKLCKSLENGDSIKGACGSVGISEKTFYNWYNVGMNARSGAKKEFKESVDIAKNKAIHKHENVIANASAKGTWQASAWWLQHRTDLYKDKVHAEIEHKNLSEYVDNKETLRLIYESEITK